MNDEQVAWLAAAILYAGQPDVELRDLKAWADLIRATMKLGDDRPSLFEGGPTP